MSLTLILAQVPQPELVWKSAPPRWAVFLAILGLALFAAAIYRRERKDLGGLARVALGVLRLAVLLALFGVFCEPVYETRRDIDRKSAVVVMVDESLSMAILDRYTPEILNKIRQAVSLAPAPGPDGGTAAPAPKPLPEQPSRIELANRILSADGGQLVERLRQKNHDIELYAFSTHLAPNIQAGQTQARGAQSRIGDALIGVVDQKRDRRISAIILLTDGQANSEEVSVADATARLADLKIPVYAIGLGSTHRPKDIELVQMRMREQALVGDKVSVAVKLAQQGYDRGRAVLLLEDIGSWVEKTPEGQLKPNQTFPLDRPGRVLETLPVELGEPGSEQDLALVHAFEREGVYFVRAIVRPLPGEERSDNNQIVMRIEIREDRLRVLYIERQPRYEYRALMRWLIRDSKIEAHVMLCSADPEFPQDKSPRAPELVWPPTREQIMGYHVVILGDVDPDRLGVEGITPQESRQILSWIGELVEKRGGGLILIAGLDNPRKLAAGPLKNALPVKIEAATGVARQFTERKRIVRTPQGEEHPIFTLVDDAVQNRSLWQSQQVGTFFGYQRTHAVPASRVLAVHPDERYQRSVKASGEIEWENYPLFVLRNHGLGKVFFTATDDTWMWRFLVGDRYFARFWAQVVRYVGSPALFGHSPHYKLWTDRREYEPLDQVTVSLEVLDHEFRPLANDSWEVRYRKPSGTEDKLFLAGNKELSPGAYGGGLTATELGRWELWVPSNPALGFTEEARTHFTIRIPNLEARNPELAEAVLKDLATKTSGEYFPAWEAQQVPDRIKQAVKQFNRSRGVSKSAWDDPLVLVTLIVLLAAEWLIRKLNRLQ